MSLKQKTIYKPIFWTLLLCLFVGTCSIVYAANEDESTEEKSDLRFPIRNGNLDTYDELDKTYPIDLPDPDNIKTKIEYDPETGHFIYKKQVGNTDLSAPLELTADEYGKQQMKNSMNSYWTSKNRELKKPASFWLSDIKFNIGPAERLFGPGGVQIKTQGSAEIIFGGKISKVQNPTQTVKVNNTGGFDFDSKIQLNATGTVGDKIYFDMNYNTEATFEADQSLLRLRYVGGEDDILQKIEAGNVSMSLSNTLIQGSQSLFGFKTELKFGKLTATALLSQQQSEMKSVSLDGGALSTDFELGIDEYDENRHFFISQYFRDNYDYWMSSLPNVTSGVVINRIEVWVTNKGNSTTDYDNSRNILAFKDLAEPSVIDNPIWTSTGANFPACNEANNLYKNVVSVSGIRDIANASSVLKTAFPTLVGGDDFEKIESARKLSSNEYTLNEKLGFISLRSALSTDQVLAVAIEYTKGGKTYQIGEFSTDASVKAPQVLVLKLLKNVSPTPSNSTWKLMMKNVYSLGAYNMSSEDFQLDIKYKSDTTGVELPYITEGNIKNKMLLSVMNLDNLNTQLQNVPDGFFDYVEGYTVLSSSGRVIFPSVEPFGNYLKKKIGDNKIAEKYIYQELYDSTLVVAREISEKNKFVLVGKYKSANSSSISLNATEIPKGSVKVTAGGVTLTENQDYVVDYTMGTVTITNQSLLESATPISISYESNSTFSMQRKSFMGVNLDYAFNKDFNIGATVLHLSEKPLTNKVATGVEPISNTIWGLNANYKKQFQWLTTALDKLPLLSLTQPSNVNFNVEFAQLIPGHSKAVGKEGSSYIDDFESAKITTDMRTPYAWFLSSVPTGLFPEGNLSNDIEYGKNRALLSWYYIDPIFYGSTSSCPEHIRKDKDYLKNNLIRRITTEELFPEREKVYGESSYIQTFNLSFYPSERGPYNIYAKDGNFDSNGKLTKPETRFGGIMRKFDNTNFESNNIEYIEFWLMDPFVYDSTGVMKGGDFYINLGDISEDILKDGRKTFENGFPGNLADTITLDKSVWGYIPVEQSVSNSFENDVKKRKAQDVGLNGLSSEMEKEYGSYKTFLSDLESLLDPTVVEIMRKDPTSPFNSPSGDYYHYFRGSDFDKDEKLILDRYKYINGMNGNSPTPAQSEESYSTAFSNYPNTEDINGDNTLNENERYYQYKISIRPEDLVVGTNHITDKVISDAGDKEVAFYQFKIPIKDYDEVVGNIRDFTSIRFARLFLTGFEEETHLRFPVMQLVRGEWRVYTKPLNDPDVIPTTDALLDVTTVNIEENSRKTPVNYVLPPGVNRVIDPSQTQVRQENEQSLALKVNDLSYADARAIYKNVKYDFRQYKRLQLCVHAEALEGDNLLKNKDMSVFIRIGSDARDNYYEYEIPLDLTSPGETDPNKVWPENNKFDFEFKLLTNTKLKRNEARRISGSTVSLTEEYAIYDPDKPNNRVAVKGNPSIGSVEVIMIGIRNNSKEVRSTEVWVNELRLVGFNEDGGVAAMANMVVGLSDLGTLSVGGHVETNGYGSLEQNVLDRRKDDLYQYNVGVNLELGKFFPEKAQAQIPLYYAFSQQINSPKYNPIDEDIELKAALASVDSKQERDSIRNLARDVETSHSINVSNVKFNIVSENPMPYDPANFTVGYSYSQTKAHETTIDHEWTKEHKGAFAYNYVLTPKPVEPLKKVKALRSNKFALIRDFNFYYLPTQISFSTNIDRYYYELQNRNMYSLLYPDLEMIELPKNVSKRFDWDRNFNFRYDIARSLKISYQSSTNATIDETQGVVNRRLYNEEYKHWSDTVKRSLREYPFGRPLAYQHVFNASWQVPINKIPIFSFISLNSQYNATFNWDYESSFARGEKDDKYVNRGDSISYLVKSVGSWQFDGRLNFETLYNKSKYLRDINRKYSSTAQRPTAQKRSNSKKNSYEQLLAMKKGKEVLVKHNLNSPAIEVVATSGTSSYPIKYKIVDNNTIRINPKEDKEINIRVVVPNEDQKESIGKKVADLSTRFLMLLRNVTVTYKESKATVLPGYLPQHQFMGTHFNYNQMGNAPGFEMLFGIPHKDDTYYINKAVNSGWLLMDENINPKADAVHTRDFQIRALIEPIPGFKINLTSTRNESYQNSIQYATGMTGKSGVFSMSYVAIGSSFSKMNKTNYSTAVYRRFLANRSIIQSRIQNQLVGTNYPNSGFLAGIGEGVPYDASKGAYSKNAQEVLIPAFLAAYSHRDVNKIKTNPLPSFWLILPNWQITYDGIGRLKKVKEVFKSVVLSHTYRCTYNAGSFTAFSNYAEGENGIGFVQDALSGNAIPSWEMEFGSVSINENFAPLFGLELTLKNNMSSKVEYRRTRSLALNLGSAQIIENRRNDFVVGFGYRIADFNIIMKTKNNSQKTVKNDLTFNVDVGYSSQHAIIRKIQEETDTELNQITSGNSGLTVSASAEYVFSEKVNFRIFYDFQSNNPFLLTSYPTKYTSFGASVKLLLSR